MNKHTAPHALDNSGNLLSLKSDVLVGWNIYRMLRPKCDSDPEIFGTASFTIDSTKEITDSQIAKRIHRESRWDFFESPRQVLCYIDTQLQNRRGENSLIYDGVNLFFTKVPKWNTVRVIYLVWNTWDMHPHMWFVDAAYIGSILRKGKIHVCCRLVER